MFDKFCENLRIEDHVRKRHFNMSAISSLKKLK